MTKKFILAIVRFSLYVLTLYGLMLLLENVDHTLTIAIAFVMGNFYQMVEDAIFRGK